MILELKKKIQKKKERSGFRPLKIHSRSSLDFLQSKFAQNVSGLCKVSNNNIKKSFYKVMKSGNFAVKDSFSARQEFQWSI